MAIVVVGEPFYKQLKTQKCKYVLVRCDCGKEYPVQCSKVPKMKGCLSCSGKTHGLTGRGEKRPLSYISWYAMKSRCTNEKHKDYWRYGGRGITVCDRWMKFENFIADMGERQSGVTLDRIDSNGNYEPGNCCWSTSSEQNRNKSNNRMLTVYGKTMPLAAWHDIVSHDVKLNTVRARLTRGWTHKESLFGKST